jgi:hypothetical protein
MKYLSWHATVFLLADHIIKIAFDINNISSW